MEKLAVLKAWAQVRFFEDYSVLIMIEVIGENVWTPLHLGKFSSGKKISFVLNLLVVHGSSQDEEKLSVQRKFS